MPKAIKSKGVIPVVHKKATQMEKARDQILEKEGHDPSAWDDPVHVTPKVTLTSIRLNSNTIEKAKHLARLHKERGYQTWLKKVIEERIRFEEAIYRDVKTKVA